MLAHHLLVCNQGLNPDKPSFCEENVCHWDLTLFGFLGEQNQYQSTSSQNCFVTKGSNNLWLVRKDTKWNDNMNHEIIMVAT